MNRDKLIDFFVGRMTPDSVKDGEAPLEYVALKDATGTNIKSPTGQQIYVCGQTYNEFYRELATSEVACLLEYLDMHGFEIAEKLRGQ